MLHIYIYDISRLRVNNLTLILLTWRKWWAPNNSSKEQMGFNSGFKGLKDNNSNTESQRVIGSEHFEIKYCFHLHGSKCPISLALQHWRWGHHIFWKHCESKSHWEGGMSHKTTPNATPLQEINNTGIVILRGVRATFVTVEKQYVLHILSAWL